MKYRLHFSLAILALLGLLCGTLQVAVFGNGTVFQVQEGDTNVFLPVGIFNSSDGVASTVATGSFANAQIYYIRADSTMANVNVANGVIGTHDKRRS